MAMAPGVADREGKLLTAWTGSALEPMAVAVSAATRWILRD